ncbi:MAG: hypothetical protein ACOY5B_02460 [Spirochaetota bacterium]
MPNIKKSKQSKRAHGFGVVKPWIIQYPNGYFDFFKQDFRKGKAPHNLRVDFEYRPIEECRTSWLQSMIEMTISPDRPELARDQATQVQRILGACTVGPVTPCLLPVLQGAHTGQAIMNGLQLALGDSIRYIYGSGLYPLFQPNSFVRTGNNSTTALIINASAPLSASLMSELASFASSVSLPDSLNQAHQRTPRRYRPLMFVPFDYLNLQFQPGRSEAICVIQFDDEPYTYLTQQGHLTKLAEPAEIQSFLAYLLKGAIDAHEIGICLKPFEHLAESWLNHQDPVSFFLKKCCKTNTDDSIKVEELWKWFKAFVDCYRIPYSGAKQSFCRRMANLRGPGQPEPGGRAYRRLIVSDDAQRVLKRFLQAQAQNEIEDGEVEGD